MKRLLDIVLSALGLIVASPVLLPVMFLVWRQDRHSPFYVAPRTGLRERPFRMVKLRSMVMNADKSGVDSTAANDRRITPVGQFVRRYKLDELTQLWNVLKGDMSLVGPRPNVERETRMYTAMEKRLLSVRPGITDYASIVFADEGDILKNYADPDIAYNQVIRPYKGRLGLFYIEHAGVWLDMKLITLTAIAIVSRAAALRAVVRDLTRRGAPADLVLVASRQAPLQPAPPPGSDQLVTERY
jgi:lipopolysaccharide/colanic/teichoic acid biosynthesis glycosyltransferase